MAFVTCSQFKTSQEAQDAEIAALKQQNTSQDAEIAALKQPISLGVDKNGIVISQGACLATCDDILSIEQRLNDLKSNNDNLSAENARLSGELEQTRSQKTELERQLNECLARKDKPTVPATPTPNAGTTPTPSRERTLPHVSHISVYNATVTYPGGRPSSEQTTASLIAYDEVNKTATVQLIGGHFSPPKLLYKGTIGNYERINGEHIVVNINENPQILQKGKYVTPANTILWEGMVNTPKGQEEFSIVWRESGLYSLAGFTVDIIA